jgi:hypothetical protein
MIGAGVAIMLSLLLKNRKRAFTIGFLTIAGAIGIFLFANYATHGGFFMHLIEYNRLPMNPWRGFLIARGFILQGPILLSFGFFAFLMLKGEWKEFECIYTSVAFAIMLCTIGYFGSSVNYFLELCAALAIVSGTLFSRIEKIGGGFKPLMYGLLIAALMHNIFIELPNLKHEYFDGGAADRNVKEIYSAATWMQNEFPPDRLILYEDIQLPLLIGRDIDFYSLNDFNIRYLAGLYKSDYLEESIRKKRWNAIVILGDYDRPTLKPISYYPWLSAQQLKAMEEEYRPVRSFKSNQKLFSLFVPK